MMYMQDTELISCLSCRAQVRWVKHVMKSSITNFFKAQSREDQHKAPRPSARFPAVRVDDS